MEVVGQRVDHRDARHARQLLNPFVREGADDDAVEIAAQYIGGVGDGFAASDLHFGLVKVERMTSQFPDSDFKRHPGAGRGFGEDQSDALSGKRGVLRFAAFILEFGGQFKDLLQIVEGDVA